MKFDSSIPLSDKEKGRLIESIYNAYKNDVREFLLEYELETHNCVHFLRWDFTNTNIIRGFQSSHFQCLKAKRGPWRFVLIYDKESGFLYSLMREKRFLELQGRVNKDRVHYVDALASLNHDLDDSSNIERVFAQDLFDMDGAQWSGEVQTVLQELIMSIDGPIKYYGLITFSSEKDEITSVTAYIPTTDLGIAHQENWNEYITADFSNTYEESAFPIDSEDDDIQIGLRDGVVPQQEEDLVQPKTDEQKEDDEG
ncbi:DUF5986 family protein [Paenibacillus sp. GCM10012307]|uniref:DUF5986 family protein n=1 Tax=Paenibacillus TaxID=44249 RepID=UPI002FCE0D2F